MRLHYLRQTSPAKPMAGHPPSHPGSVNTDPNSAVAGPISARSSSTRDEDALIDGVRAHLALATEGLEVGAHCAAAEIARDEGALRHLADDAKRALRQGPRLHVDDVPEPHPLVQRLARRRRLQEGEAAAVLAAALERVPRHRLADPTATVAAPGACLERRGSLADGAAYCGDDPRPRPRRTPSAGALSGIRRAGFW